MAETSSVLGGNQRKWLKGEDVYKQPDRKVRMHIRQRFAQAFEDLALIYESDRIDTEDLLKEVTEKNQDGDGGMSASQYSEIAAHKNFKSGFLAESMETAFLHLDTVAKREIEDPNELVNEVVDSISELVGEYVKNEMYPYIAVLGAYAAMRSAIGTDKAAAQWVLNHFPEGQEREKELQKVRKSID